MIVSTDYLCPVHGHFEVAVETPTPDVVTCPHQDEDDSFPLEEPVVCGEPSPWSPTAMGFKVKRIEVVRGKYEKPERKTWLDTRELGEGQDIQDFREKRSAIRDQERKAAVMEMLK